MQSIIKEQKILSHNELMDLTKKSIGICNSCRYCEGFCAVFPAMEKRLSFADSDISYLANLCHNCSECLYACQFAPPHEFGVNIPKQLSMVRTRSYEEFAMPTFLSSLFVKHGLISSLVLVLLLAMFLLFTTFEDVYTDTHNFYSYISHTMLVLLFGLAFVWMLVSVFMSCINFRNYICEKGERIFTWSSLKIAMHEAFSLKYLHGNVKTGCTYPGDDISPWRRYFHHATFYGFILCFAATASGTIMHYFFGLHAPYDFISLPKLLGTFGGISLTIGTAGLFVLKLKANPEIRDARHLGMDYAFIALLFLAAVTGLILMFFRMTDALPTLLSVHLSVILTLFITMPFSKFIHGFYRFIALSKNATEELNLSK
ncbi:tricarballylate utilization 4Fe-4S protein TcuB [Taylorella equigenitalis]|uniref:tricarballylate utilization 4Fe-4S protein TcuB n=1 Tax=Taylorella equigenitalis TaxID=29575 RepID=UPI0004055A0B|nr:tricarballylate utilization 4Fe-4S protein TcuB [Taylorella equigenitalis]ASY31037.1 TcuB protein [Taylorella equigenitalis]KOS58722.1 TcuB protein [Taylorella equigenitalis]